MPTRRKAVEHRAPKDIIEYCTSDEFLGDKDYSPAQLSILKAIYGLDMTRTEAAAFLAMNEGRPPRKGGYDEASLGLGRGSGKSMKIAARIISYEAVTFDYTLLASGETAYAICVAQNEKAALIVRNFAEADFRTLESKGYNVFAETAAQSKPVTAEVIRLRGNVHVACFPCKKISVRGIRTIAVVFDEFGHWQLEELAYNADKEIVRAVRPTRLKFRSLGCKVPFVKISTPFDEVGEFHEDYRTRDRTRQLVLHEVPTRFLNPAITEEELAKEQLRDPDSYDREWLAKWGSGRQAKPITRAMVEANTDAGRLTVPPRPGTEYKARLDAAYRKDHFPVGVAHLEGETVVVDLLHVWKPRSAGRHLDDKVVCEEMSTLLLPYTIDQIGGDQFCDIPLKTELAKYNIGFRECPTTESSKFIEYQNLIAVLSARRLRLPDDPDIMADLTGIQKKGKWVGAPKLAGRHDDIFTVVRGLVFDLLPMIQRGADLEVLNAGAMANDRDRLLKERGFPVPEDAERLPTDIMGMTF